ncbi:MAG: YggS family pyridoxal phosphate-dependent enzyme [Abditibacteriota bacterium]|nr:YggS family pyridoxal phosphate-dependent enzyme [Abditibacteriota bacterium]
MKDIKSNLDYIKDEIILACDKCGRDPKEITLIGVSKTKPVSLINEAIDLGLTDIGENYVQEVLEKINSLKPVNLHFIGHLQSNKAKQIVPHAHLIHSVDSLSLLKEIDKEALKNNKIQDILLEINISCEESKFGIKDCDIQEFLDKATSFKNIKIKGLMGMAPFLDNKEDTRPYFAKLRSLFDTLPEDMRIYLSMGMSGDFREAIYEGSNMIRIGTAIFGAREYKTF